MLKHSFLWMNGVMFAVSIVPVETCHMNRSNIVRVHVTFDKLGSDVFLGVWGETPFEILHTNVIFNEGRI